MDNLNTHCTGEFVKQRFSTSRKVLYLMLGAGLHGVNGLNSKVNLRLIRIYVIPHLVYSLNVVRLTSKDIFTLVFFHEHLLNSQPHPDYIGAICNDISVLMELACRHISTKYKLSKSRIVYISTPIKNQPAQLT